MSVTNKGSVCFYGIGAGQVGSLFVQSYTVTSGYNNTATVVNEEGETVTARYDDIRSELMVEGVAKTTDIPELGGTLTFIVKTASAYPDGDASLTFKGTITKVDDRGSSKGFVSVSVTAESFEYINYTPTPPA
jgi:hypothetical protein